MGLGIAVANDPESAHTDEQNFSTHQELGGDEWEEIFVNVLSAPVDTERLPGEDYQDFLNRRERLFKRDLADKGYEMLGRSCYILNDVFYAPSEVVKLLDECLEVRQKTENKGALSGLEKLIQACREALKVKSGIFLAAD